MGGRLPSHTNKVDRFDPKSEQFVSSNRHLPEVNNGQAAAVSIGPDHSASIYVVGGDGGRDRVQVLPILNNLSIAVVRDPSGDAEIDLLDVEPFIDCLLR